MKEKRTEEAELDKNTHSVRHCVGLFGFGGVVLKGIECMKVEVAVEEEN